MLKAQEALEQWGSAMDAEQVYRMTLVATGDPLQALKAKADRHLRDVEKMAEQ